MKATTRSKLAGLGIVIVAVSLALGVRSTQHVAAVEDHDAFIDRYMDVADQIDPDLANRLRSMCQIDPTGFEVVLRRLGPMLSGLADLQREDPVLYQRKIEELHLEATVAALAVEARRAELFGDERDMIQQQAMRAQLTAMVRAQVLTSIENQSLFIERLRDHLADLEAQLAAESSNVDGTVSRRVDELLAP